MSSAAPVSNTTHLSDDLMPRAVALYDYTAGSSNEISFNVRMGGEGGGMGDVRRGGWEMGGEGGGMGDGRRGGWDGRWEERGVGDGRGGGGMGDGRRGGWEMGGEGVGWEMGG